MAFLEEIVLLSEKMQLKNTANHDYNLELKHYYSKSEINFIMTMYWKHELFLVIQVSLLT